MTSKKKWLLTLLIVASVISTAAIIACVIYFGDYYRADEDAIAAFAYDGSAVIESVDGDGNLIFAPTNPTAGLIFYPGGKVEHTAYTPLMRALSEKGVLCVLIEMPLNLAIFDTGAAHSVKDEFAGIDKWYICGHSLGGSAAAMYAGRNPDEFEGMILLASYSTSDLSDTGMDVLSIYGTEDGVMNREKYDECRSNLPADFAEEIIDGGCHAYFGMYGAQDGDGTPNVSAEEQISITAGLISRMIISDT